MDRKMVGGQGRTSMNLKIFCFGSSDTRQETSTTYDTEILSHSNHTTHEDPGTQSLPVVS